MNDQWKLLMMALVGLVIVVSSRRYIRNASELSEGDGSAPAKAYWRMTARWEVSTLWAGWAIVVCSLVAFVAQLIGLHT